jgi:DNA-binding response OmpR family regulator
MSGTGNESGGCVVGDADIDSRAVISGLLAQIGMRVLEAETGPDALDLALAQRPDAVMLDVELAGMSGYQVCHILRVEYGADLPIFLLARERNGSHDEAAALLIGANAYIEKPFAASELLVQLEAHLRNGRDGAPMWRRPITR